MSGRVPESFAECAGVQDGQVDCKGLDRAGRVEEYLLRACKANGLLGEDGEKQCRDTLRSGIEAGMRVPYHDIRWRVGG